MFELFCLTCWVGRRTIFFGVEGKFFAASLLRLSLQNLAILWRGRFCS
ncbi:hypothetical protein ES319_D12G234100v1 [Gossypium barbadense]|uniref:Uncharacterized protein n=1 Tax=Gossypium barbadense TaxID=3634 RepID=A0A5J5P490_GOSBA|nr:hypothetical protein ES319_D12G234100v1 [Gossypium barbadense]